MDPHFLKQGTIKGWVISYITAPLYPQYKSYTRLGDPQNLSGRCGVQKHVLK
jgi:hypothetical protein